MVLFNIGTPLESVQKVEGFTQRRKRHKGVGVIKHELRSGSVRVRVCECVRRTAEV